MKKYTIKDVREGKIYLKNDGTLDKLKKILKLAFPNDDMIPDGDYRYYGKQLNSDGLWGQTDHIQTPKPVQSIKDFILEERLPEFGEKILVWDDGCKTQGDGYFIGFTDSNNILVTKYINEITLLRHNVRTKIEIIPYNYWSFIEEDLIVEVTLEEVAKLKGCSVEKLRIKE